MKCPLLRQKRLAYCITGGLNNAVYSHSSQLPTIVNNIVESESGVTMLNNIVDNCEQCRQHNECLFRTTMFNAVRFLAVHCRSIVLRQERV